MATNPALLQFRVANLFCKLARDFIQCDNLAERHQLADKITCLRRIAFRIGIQDLDRIYHYRQAIARNETFYTSGSKTYSIADYFGPPLALGMRSQPA
jgi:hypothetical protein